MVLPLLRPLMLLRPVTLLTVLNRYAGSSLRGRVAAYMTGATSLIMLVAALAVLDAGARRTALHRVPRRRVWWALTTVTTVECGDRSPVTTTGRAVAGGLMLAGIALLGRVTATSASWFIERVAEVEQESEAATRRGTHCRSHRSPGRPCGRARALASRSRIWPGAESIG